MIDHKVLAGVVFAITLSMQTSKGGADAAQDDPVNDVFGVSLNMNAHDVRERLDGSCRTFSIHESAQPILPIAQVHEQQIICVEFDNEDRKFGEVAFVFGDDELHMIEAFGSNAKTTFDQLPGKPFPYAGHWANREALAFVEEMTNRLVFLTGEGAHAHLLLWRSPFLLSNKMMLVETPASALPPPVLRFGESPEALRAMFETDCDVLAERPVNNPLLASISKQQIQLDCFGIDYAGFPRKLEAVFAGDRLELAWILIGKAEEERMRDALTAEYGAPIETGQRWEVFHSGRVALRKDKSEVLFLSERAGSVFANHFKQ
jgi:hypothetical protein